MYAGAYSLARFICEFYREPDFGIGFVLWGMSMGQFKFYNVYNSFVSLYLYKV